MPPPGTSCTPLQQQQQQQQQQRERGHWRGRRCAKDATITTSSSSLFLLSPSLLFLPLLLLVLSAFITPVTSNSSGDLDLHGEVNDVIAALQARAQEINPSLAVTVVKDGQVMLSAGYGRTGLSGPREDVDSSTRFNIASLSKAFTATLLLKVMEEDGRYNVSSKVRDILDCQLQFGDELRTQEATVEDILSHKMAIPANNRMRFSNNLTRASVKDHVRYLKTPYLFRNLYIYSNLMYGLATYLTEVIGGKPWETLVREHLYEPLGMTRSTFVKDSIFDAKGIARPYKFYFGKLKPLSPLLNYQWSELAGSGSVVSTADDMAKWMNFHLSKGLGPGDKRVMSEDTLEELYKPRTAMNKPAMTKFRRPESPVTFTYDVYSMGFRRGYYRGYPIVGHGGSSFGYRSLLNFMPSHKLGIFTVMSGGDTNYQLRGTLHAVLMDHVLNVSSSWLDDGDSSLLSFLQPSNNASDGKPRLPYDIPVKRLAYNVSAYVGLYHNPAYGTFEVREWQDSPDDGKEPQAPLTLFYGFATWDLVPLRSSSASSDSDPSDSEAFYGKGRNVSAWLDYSPFLFHAPPEGSDVVERISAKGLESRSPPVFTRVGVETSGCWTPGGGGYCGLLLLIVVTWLLVDF